MPLEEYSRKRTFSKTPEPTPLPSADAVQPARNSFCVQRHHASHLHYDFRLEIDGVLKSWAVPKGPSMRPLAKQLAIQVEDHPVAYGGFEGNIPKGEYGGGSVMLWDRGVYELLPNPSGNDNPGDIKFRLFGEKLKGEFALVLMKARGNGKEWLLIKKRDHQARSDWNLDDFAFSVLTGRTQDEIAADAPAKLPTLPTRTMPEGAVALPMPETVAPMMAEIATTPPTGDNWLYEIKWDGVRALCFLKSKSLRILSRAGNRCDQQYPELGVLPFSLQADTAILDGEIAALDEQGRPRFALIQSRIHVADPGAVAQLARRAPVTLFLFDLLYLDGFDLRAVPLHERKRLLQEIVTPNDRLRVSDHFVGNGADMLEAARQSGLEGVMAKLASSRYEPKRSRNWLKIKVNSRQEFVICGFTHGEREYFGALILGVYEEDQLVHVGQVGTGFTDRTMAEIHQQLKPLIVPRNPLARFGKKLPKDATWVRPVLVCEVKYLEFTPDGQLRAPVFMGLREDKPAQLVAREVEPEPAPAEQKFGNLTKIFFPKDGVTKGDVIDYYNQVAPWILPHLQGRPLSLKRYPNGIHADYFFQKNVADKKFPTWVRTVKIEAIEYVVCDDKPTLLYLANLGCIDHNPFMSRVGSLDYPDFVLIDLDPYECPFDLIVEAAILTHNVLEAIGLRGYPKTTGGDGMHIYVPLEPLYTFDQVRTFAEVLWHYVVSRNPGLFTTPRAVARRKPGRVYFDYLQIGRSKTIAAPYVLRAHDGAPVATPLAWDEVVPGLSPAHFHIRNAIPRFQKLGDLFAGALTDKQTIEQPLERLSALILKK